MRINLYRAKPKRFAQQEKKEEPPPEQEEPPPEQEEPPPEHIKAQFFTYLIPFGDYLVFAAAPSVSVRLSDLYSNQNIRYIINILRDKETRFFLAAAVILAIAFFIRDFVTVHGVAPTRIFPLS